MNSTTLKLRRTGLFFLALITCIATQSQAMQDTNSTPSKITPEFLYRHMAYRQMAKVINRCAKKAHVTTETSLDSERGAKYVQCVNTKKVSENFAGPKAAWETERSALRFAVGGLHNHYTKNFDNKTVGQLNGAAEEALDKLIDNLYR